MISRIFWPGVRTAEGLWDESPHLSNVSPSQRFAVVKVYTSDPTELICVFAVIALLFFVSTVFIFCDVFVICSSDSFYKT